MLLHFYLFCLLFIFFILGFSLLQKKLETSIRALTLLVVFHVTFLAIWQGTLAFTILIGLLLVLSLYELSEYYQTNRILLIITNLILFIASLFSEQQFREIILPCFILICIITFISERKTIETPSFIWAFASCFLIPCSVFLIELMKASSGQIILLLLLLQLNDSFGYLFGKKLGKTYLFKTISPNKTLEGYLCGGIGIILGIFLLHTYIPVLPPQPLYKDILIFLSILIFGNLGDLLLSSLKRKLEIKDFSNILPGHGGILDRFDNLLFVAPIFYMLFTHQWIYIATLTHL